MRNRILTVAMVVTAAAFAAKIRVPSQQPTIQAGLNAAVANDTVLVAAGTYYERLTWPNRDGITLLSEDGAGSTAIDGGRAGRVITMTAMTYSGATLVEGFTVTNGLVAGNGAGIICNGSPTIGYNRIVHNVMSLFSGYGAGFYSNGAPFVHHNLFAYDTISDPAAGGFRYGPAAFCRSSGVFYENVFMENYSLGGSGFGYGGALYLERDNPVVLSNLFVRNRAENSSGFTYGGGLYIGTSANAFVANNTFVGNSVQASIVYGGAVYTANLVASIVNNVIVQNTSSGAIPYGGGIATGASATPYPVYDYNDLWSNVPANYYNCTAGPNAISANPEFKSVGWGDYFLSQVAAGQPLTSPCVDAGTVLPTSPVNMDSLIHAWTTRTDSVPDAGAADMGFHYHFLPWTHDVGVTRILSPGSISDTNVSVVPACSAYNYGTAPETYDVRFSIGSYEQTATVTSHAPATYRYVEFSPAWVPSVLGNIALICSTELALDQNKSNNRKDGVTFVRKRDAAVVSLTAPAGTYPAGYVLQPVATWRNEGNMPADFDAWMILSDPTGTRVYAEKVSLTGVSPGVPVQVGSFPTRQLDTPGQWAVRCSTALDGDVRFENDVIDRGFIVGSPDMRVSEIVSPVGNVDTNETVVPAAGLHNDGDLSLPFVVWFVMNNPNDAEVYRERVDVTGLAPAHDTVIEFPGYGVGETTGSWTTRCSVYVAGDVDPDDDAMDGGFEVRAGVIWPLGWVEVKNVPGIPTAKQVKDGGWLATGPDRETDAEVVYAAKGNKTTDFFKYYPLDDSWVALRPVEADEGGRLKPPKKGCAGVSDGVGSVYMTKGNNTLGFWKYSIIGDTWTRLPDVPVGPANKKVKGGGDLAYAVGVGETGWVYLMKGYKTEFYRYNTESSRWDTLDDVPYGVAPKYNAGSFLTYDEGGYLYAHQAKYTDAAKVHHYMFRYDLAGQKWDDTLAGMPVSGMDGGKMKLKKSKDGGSGAWYDGSLYALKGGNTCQFYKYAPAPGDTWTELDTIASFGSTAKKKKVKAGGDLASFGGGAFFALKGNKTNEFWRYVIPTVDRKQDTGNRGGVQANPSTIYDLRMTISPNPMANGFATLRYSLPKPGPVAVNVFDVAGRSVFFTRSLGHLITGSLPLNLRGLSAGVYLVRLDTGTASLNQKLIVLR